MNYIFVPGCALMSYKPRLAELLKQWAERHYGKMTDLLTCCFNRPELVDGCCLVTPCTTCDQRYRKLYPECGIRFMLEDLADADDFPFPDYAGVTMSIQDTCSGRTDPRYLNTVRRLLQRMHIKLVEPAKSGPTGRCCGQILYGKQPLEKVELFMKSRASEMPCDEVVVYCASCIQAIHCGGRKPRYLLDLLFGESTDTRFRDIVEWNSCLYRFRESH